MPRGVYSRQFYSQQAARERNNDPILIERVRSLYQSGMTQAGIANELGLTQSIILRLMRDHQIPTRLAGKRTPLLGADNPRWTGSEASYDALHHRVAFHRGHPKKCEVCGTTDINLVYDWACMTGHYEDPDDYKRLCRACHRGYDVKRRKSQGVQTARFLRRETTARSGDKCPRCEGSLSIVETKAGIAYVGCRKSRGGCGYRAGSYRLSPP
jgi:hypothetical protein